MMIQNNVFPVEGPQSTNDPIAKEITCSAGRLRISSLCEAELLLNNCPSAMEHVLGGEHWLRMEVPKSSVCLFSTSVSRSST